MNLKNIIGLAFCISLTTNAWSQGSCGPCSGGTTVEYVLHEDINGSFNMMVSGVEVQGTGYDSKAMSHTEGPSSGTWPKMIAGQEYAVSVNVGTDAGEPNGDGTDKGNDTATIYFTCDEPCGYDFEVYSGPPGSEQWGKTKKTAVHSNESSTTWGFGAGDEYPTNTIKIRLKKKDTDSGKDDGSTEPEDTEDSIPPPTVSEPSINDPQTDVPTGPTDQPDSVNPPNVTHEIPLGKARSSTSSDGIRTSAGTLRLSGPVGTQNLASRVYLNHFAPSDAIINVKRDAANIIEQVETGTLLAIASDLDAQNPLAGFRVCLYAEGKYQEVPNNPGTYELLFGALPYAACRYSPIAAVAGTHNGGIQIEIRIVEVWRSWDVVAPAANACSWQFTQLDSESNDPSQVVQSESTFIPVDSDTKWSRIETKSVMRDGQLYSKIERDFLQLKWSEVLLSEKAFSSPTAFQETQYAYYTDPTTAYYGKLKHVIRPDGSWRKYVYLDHGGSWPNGDFPGGLLRTYEPWLDAPASPDDATNSNCVRTEYFYGFDPQSDALLFTTELIKTEKFILGTVTARTETSFAALTPGYQRTLTSLSTADGSILTHYADVPLNSDWGDIPEVEVAPDRSLTSTTFALGNYTPATGAFVPDTQGTFVEKMVRNGYADASGNPVYVAGKSTGTRYISDVRGRRLRENMLVFDGTTWAVASTRTWLHQDTDNDGLHDKTTGYKEGVVISTTHRSAPRETRTTDEAGWETISRKDEMGRTESVTRVGQNGQTDVITSHSYNGRATSTTISAGSLSLTASQQDDLLGRAVSSDDENGLTTSYDYSYGTTGGRITTATGPDGGTTVNSTYRDGSSKSTTGTSVVATYTAYDLNTTNGFLSTTTRIGTANSPRYSTTLNDWAGRPVSTTKPAFTGTWQQVNHYHPSLGLLLKASTTGMADMLYEYDSLGNPERQGMDADGNGALTPSSTDLISETMTDYLLENTTDWVTRTTTSQWLANGSPAKTTMGVSKTKLNSPYGDRSSTDVHGDTTTTLTSIASGVVTVTTDVPFADAHQVTVSAGGRLVSQSSPTSGNVQTNSYDDLGRVDQITGSRGDVAATTYYPGSSRVDTVTPPLGPVTKYLYIPEGQPGAGQVEAVITLDRKTGGELSRVSYTYDLRGNKTSETGTGTYPVVTEYDPVYPDRIRLKTYRNQAGGVPDVTTWIHQPATGLITRKQYADGKGTNYEYHPSGMLSKRTWQRGVSTIYAYENTGFPDTVTYSDGTPAIDYLCNRAGRIVQVTDSAGTRTISHAADGQMTQETIAGSGFLSGYAITNAFGTAGHGLRDSITVTLGSNTVAASQFTYQPATARPATAAQAGSTATYGYEPFTDLVASVAMANASTTLFTQRTHRDLAGRVVGVISRSGASVSGTILASAGYALDAKGRRSHLTREDGTRWEYGYNTRDEVTAGSKQTANDNDPLAGRQFSYAYDDIGNRTSANYGGDANGQNLRTISYQANEVNQYDSISHPGHRHILGFSEEPGDITVASQVPGSALTTTGPAVKQGDLWSAEVLHSTTQGFWENLHVIRTEGGNPHPVGDGKIWFPPATLVPTHDDDGNLLSDGRWSYSWNAENRLVAMVTSNGALAGGHPWQRLTFSYDYIGRRIAKQVETGSPANPVLAYSRVFVYDAWNLIAEMNSTASTHQTHATYLWGLDLSGTEQGAGGVGGLLSSTQISQSPIPNVPYYPSYDGNGNIIAWSDALGTVRRRIDYDPFGNVTTAETASPTMPDLPFGFSTKYTDSETGLLYYGHRYYDPVTGRWPSRDPIEEEGGINLYGFVGNNGICDIDYLGLIEVVFYSCSAEATWELEYAKISNPKNPTIESVILSNKSSGSGISSDIGKAAADAMDQAASTAALDIKATPTPKIRTAFTKAWFTYKGITSLQCRKCCMDITQSGPPLSCEEVDVSSIKKHSNSDKDANDAALEKNKEILKQIINF